MGKGNTPEGKVKRAVKKVLDHFGVMYDMPVPGGFGKSQLDFTCCIPPHGMFMSIETKAPGEKLTGPQRELCKRTLAHGGKVFIISEGDGITALFRFLQRVRDGRTGHTTSDSHPV